MGALTLHTGRNYKLTDGHKKCQRLCWRTSSPVSNVVHCKDGGSFREKQEIGRKKKRFATSHGEWALLRALFQKTDKIVFERRILSFSAGGGNFTLNPDGFCSVHKLFNFGIYRQKNGCHVPCSPKLKSSSVGKKFNRDRQPSFRITCHTKMAMMDTKMAQFRIEPLTEALPESIHSLDLALQIWGIFLKRTRDNTKKAPTFTSRDLS